MLEGTQEISSPASCSGQDQDEATAGCPNLQPWGVAQNSSGPLASPNNHPPRAGSWLQWLTGLCETNKPPQTSLAAAASHILSVVNITPEMEPAESGGPLTSQTLPSDTPQSLHTHKSHSSPLQTCLFLSASCPCHRVGFAPLSWRMETSATGFSVLNSILTGSYVMAALGCQPIERFG